MDRYRRTVLRVLGTATLTSAFGSVAAGSQGLSVTTAGASTVDDTSVTLRGRLTGMGDADSVEVALKYRHTSSTDASDFVTATRERLSATGAFSVAVSGLSADTEYEYQATANAGDERTHSPTVTFHTAAADGSYLSVTTEGTSSVDDTSATLHGRLDGMGDADSAEVALKYRRGSSTDASDFVTATRERMSATGTFSADVSGLSADTEYEFHATAAAGDRRTNCPNVGFETAEPRPELAVSTDGSAAVDDSSATFEGTLADLDGASSAAVSFEYRGTDADSWQTVAAGTMSAPGSFSADVTGLSPGTDYEFRAVAEADGADSDTGTVASFTTESDTSDAGSNFAYTDGFADVSWFDDSAEVVTVTNLDSSGHGSLRWAVDREGPTLVVFEVSGTIDLDGDWLTVSNDETWIAGQTAPSPGITVVRGRVSIAADDCVVQHLRFRPGDEGGGNPDSLDTLKTADGTANNVIDHCSTSWSVDEVLSVGYRTDGTTVTNCLIAEALDDSIHSKGPHGYGSLTGDGATDVTYAGNVWAHNTARNPRLKADTTAVVVNNVMYHFDEATNTDWAGEYAIEGNAYLRADADDRTIEGGARGDEQADAYIADNVSEPETQMTNGYFDRLDSRPLWPDGLSAMPSGEVEEHNLAYAGARPADRTDTDSRVIEQVGDRTGDYIDSQSEVGGYPDLAEHSHSLDVPDSGLREWIDQWALSVEESDANPP